MTRTTGWIALCFALAGTAALAGCAAMQRSEAKQTEDLLAAAGFHQFPADNPERTNALKTMKPRPTNCDCLYAGTESNYQEYKRLALQKQIADENLAAEQAAQDAAMDYGMWGPWW